VWEVKRVTDRGVGQEPPGPTVDELRCDGCGLCVRICPEQVLVLERGRVVVVDLRRCSYAGLCELICPNQAIRRHFEIIDPG
jgi:NAD-dependent dihydropyrimidine dehydrogenase PreA subunit